MLKTASNIGRRRRSFVETPEGLVQALSFYYCSHRLSAVPDILDRVVAIAPVPLLPGEKEADYASLAASVVGTARPEDAIEELLVRDIIDLTWEVFRHRRAKQGF